MKKLFALFQSVLPQHAISRLTGVIAASELAPLRWLLINVFLRLYKVNLAEAEQSDPTKYASFNALFTRNLRADSRPVSPDPNVVISPVDGTVSQCGAIESGQLVQAKGHHYSVRDLLGGDAQVAQQFANGQFATIYLAPHNYHRIHTPLTASLSRMSFIPGRLFSVSPATTLAVDNLFARNERVVFYFESDRGPVALVMVGAMNVGSIETLHQGVIAPGGNEPRSWTYEPTMEFARNQQLGWFNLGSTVILLFAQGVAQLQQDLHSGQKLQVGETIARI